MNLNKRTSISLIELLIAVLIFSFVIISVISIDLAWRSYSQRTNTLNTLTNEANLAIEHIIRNLSQALGNYLDPAICNTPLPPCATADIVNASAVYARTKDGKWQYYLLNSNCVQYDNDISDATGPQPITGNYIVNLYFNVSSTVPNLVNISITARQNPAAPTDPVRNPQVQLQTVVAMSAVSGTP